MTVVIVAGQDSIHQMEIGLPTQNEKEPKKNLI